MVAPYEQPNQPTKYEDLVFNNENFRSACAAAAALNELPEKGGDFSIGTFAPALENAQSQLEYLIANDVDVNDAHVIIALAPQVQKWTFSRKNNWEAQAKLYKELKAKNFNGIGLGFATATRTIAMPGSEDLFLNRLQYAVDKYPQKDVAAVGGYALLTAQLAVMPTLFKKDLQKAVDNLEWTYSEFKDNGITDEFGARLLAGHFSYLAGGKESNFPTEAITKYVTRLKDDLQVDELTAIMMTILPVYSGPSFYERFGSMNDNMFKRTKEIYDKAKSLAN